MGGTIYGSPQRTDIISQLAGQSLRADAAERGRRIAWTVAYTMLAVAFVEGAILVALYYGLMS